MGFTSTLKVERVPGKGNWRKWKLLEDFTFIDPETGKSYTVPKGFITDGASIPRILWPFLSPTGPYFESAVIHDWVYAVALFGIDEAGRKEADDLFLSVMMFQDIRKLRRKAMHRAVRRWGGRTETWKKHHAMA